MATNPFVAGEDPTGDLPDADTFSKTPGSVEYVSG